MTVERLDTAGQTQAKLTAWNDIGTPVLDFGGISSPTDDFVVRHAQGYCASGVEPHTSAQGSVGVWSLTDGRCTGDEIPFGCVSLGFRRCPRLFDSMGNSQPLATQTSSSPLAV